MWAQLFLNYFGLCYFIDQKKGGGVMVFKATFNNISVILWRSVLLVDETRVPGENYSPAVSH
jgi:hypothetical protein